ncbi:MAG: HlyD family efflux transporter periplasmic adaptor subunit [Gemmatimonadota bacterium]|nr:MAG: HlyD family efflux transporter periplasmic adaptor subunit [Gemmatimonadota bacterium]
MDIPRAPRKRKAKYMYGAGAFTAVAFVAAAVFGIQPAAPSVERSTVFVDVVRRGTMLRQVRGPGTLVPEQIRWVPAVTAGRVERRYLEPGTRVEAGTVLIELSNPDVQLELLEAERQLSSVQAQLVTLRTTLETQRLNQEAVVASTQAQYSEARRNADAADELVQRNLMAASEAQTAKERAEELATRLDIERRRLAIQAGAIGEQLAVQESQVVRLERIVRFHRERITSMRVVAGTSGVLQEISVEEGQWVLPGQTLAKVVQPERLKAVVRIPEVQARDVTVGLRALIDTRTDTIPGRVIRIDPAVQGGTVTVDVALDGELPPGARPDLSVDGMIEIERLENVLYVGRPVFGQSGSTVGLFRLTPDGGHAERVRVRLGRGSVNTIEILEGLVEGDQVILSDMSQWDDEDRVRLR